MGKTRIQYKDKPFTVGGRVLNPYTFFINEQSTMTAFATSTEVKFDKLGRDYIRIEIFLSRDGRGFWSRGFLYSNGRVAYVDGQKNFVKLRGLYKNVYDAFLNKFETTEIKHAEKRRDLDDDARIFGDLPKMRQPQRCTDYVRYNDTRYQIHKLSSGNDSSNDFNDFSGTNSGQSAFCYAWTGSLRPQCSKTKVKDYTKDKPVYVGKTSHDDEKKKTHFAPELGKYLDQFNNDEYAEVIFREAMTALRDNFA